MNPSTLERRRTRPAHSPEGDGHRANAHPRVAARRRAVEHHRSRRKMLVAGGLSLLLVMAGGLWLLAHSRFLSARVLTVVGNHHTTGAQVLAAAGLSRHPPMIDVNVAAAARAIEALPWIATATVQRHWPDGVSVQVREHRAVAVVAQGTQLAELDRAGRVLAVASSAPSGLPHVVSVGVPGAPGTTLKAARHCLIVTASLPVAFASMVSSLSPSNGGGVDIALNNGVDVVLGSPTQLPAKYEDIASLLAGAALVPGDVIDVSVPASPTVVPPGVTSTLNG